MTSNVEAAPLVVTRIYIQTTPEAEIRFRDGRVERRSRETT
jgi:hypothetical protein